MLKGVEGLRIHPGRGKTTPTGGSTYWMPRADVRETADAFFIDLDVPGVDGTDIDMTAENGALKIAGRPRVADDAAHKASRWMLHECPQGSFRRDFTLPESADTRDVEARLCNGVLSIRIAKHARNRRRRIEISH